VGYRRANNAADLIRRYYDIKARLSFQLTFLLTVEMKNISPRVAHRGLVLRVAWKPIWLITMLFLPFLLQLISTPFASSLHGFCHYWTFRLSSVVDVGGDEIDLFAHSHAYGM